MSIKDAVRNLINRNSLTRKWFVAFTAHFAIRLFALQRFLSITDLKGKVRMAAWRQVFSSLEEAPLDKIVITPDTATLIYQDGCAFEVANSSTSFSPKLLVGAEYERGETALLRGIVEAGWTAIDAGANFGWHAVHLSRLVGSDGKVLAFEPVPDSFQELSVNAALNSCDNLELFCMAIGNSSDPVNIFVPQIALGSGAASQFLDAGQKVQVPMTKLDDIVKASSLTRVDFLKADIEGGELNLLRGGENLLRTFRPTILIEIVDIHCRRFGHAPEAVYKYLSERGYRGRYITDQGDLLDLEPLHLPNGNFLFEPK